MAWRKGVTTNHGWTLFVACLMRVFDVMDATTDAIALHPALDERWHNE
jgi:hypothetical protein